MEESSVQTLVAMETSKPLKKLNRSAGALYLVLTVLILAVISIGNLLFSRWQISRYFVQPPLYVLIAFASIFVYRGHYVSFRYTLTDQTLAIERIAGNTERTYAAVLLTEIESIHTLERQMLKKTHVLRAYVRSVRELKAVFLRIGENKTAIVISPSEDFNTKLITQWETAINKESK